jgi:hypothetical protein
LVDPKVFLLVVNLVEMKVVERVEMTAAARVEMMAGLTALIPVVKMVDMKVETLAAY